MGRAEGVVHIDVGEGGEAAGEVVAVLRLGLVEAEVLEEQHFAGGEALRRLFRGRAYAVFDEMHRDAEALAERVRDDGQGELGLALALGPAQMGSQHHARLRGEQAFERRQGGPDPAVVGDPTVGERHVQVRADEDAKAGEVACGEQVVEALDGQGDPPARTRRRRVLAGARPGAPEQGAPEHGAARRRGVLSEGQGGFGARNVPTLRYALKCST